MPSALQTITFIIGSIVVIVAAYYATYWLARSSQRMQQGRAIRVLDRFSLAKDKSIVVISVYDKVYLVAFSGGAVAVLDNLDTEDIPLSSLKGALGQNGGTKASGTVFGEILKKLPWIKDEAPKPNIPFEMYLEQEQLSRQQAAAENVDNLEAVYDRIRKRRGKEAQYSAFSDTAYYEEDIHK